MATPKVFGIVLAGGEGKRLMPLTKDRAKPAVPFAGHYRLVDFAISNLINSGLRQIVCLTQYKSHSLDRHVSQTWRLSGMLNAYVASAPAQQRLGKRWFAGSADAIYQSLNLIRDENPDIVVVVGADHVYRMDFEQMIAAHRASGAGVTVAGIRQPKQFADQFGVIEQDPSAPGKIARFLEKPDTAEGLADSPDEILASMGNYVFDAQGLMQAVIEDAESDESDHDMGGDIVPAFVERGDAYVYDMVENDIPGATVNDRLYWRDVGTIDSFYDAHIDLIATDPAFNLFNSQWPIYTQQWNLPPAKFTTDASGRTGDMTESLVSLGSLVEGATVRGSVLGQSVRVHPGASVTDSIVFEKVTIGEEARVHRAILDKGVVVAPGASVGYDPDLDRSRGFTVTASGITVVAKGLVVA
jgi:glucose-1-phosphate adenylyltransferase